MKAIRETMTDISSSDDESASFLIEESLSSKKAIRLWADHLEVDKRCEEDQFHFLLVSFTVNKGAEGYDKENCVNYSNDDSHTFFVCNEFDELAAELSIQIPQFKESYELFLANEKALTLAN
jgi:hypothetical protein